MDPADARAGCRQGFVLGSRPRKRAKPASRRATLTMGAPPHPRQGRSQTAPPPESRDWRAADLSDLQAERCVAWLSAVGCRAGENRTGISTVRIIFLNNRKNVRIIYFPNHGSPCGRTHLTY